MVTARTPDALRAFSGREEVPVPRHEGKVQIADHAATAGKGRHGVRTVSSHQAGDPICAIKAIIKVVEGPDTPYHLMPWQ